MPALHFLFEEFFREIDSMKRIAARFLAADAEGAFGILCTTLEMIRSTPPNRDGHVWEIPDHTPLRTRPTRHYEPGGRGAEDVIGEITSRWLISPWTDKPLAKKTLPRIFALTGNASIRVRILRARQATGKPDELAMWRMELGASDSPGCFFHVQVLGRPDDVMFPASLSVPRLPALAFTPMAALEFLLGELFQDEWRRRAAEEDGPMDIWKSIQRSRLQRLLAWKMEKVERCVGSPWVALKSAKPENSDMFIRTQR